MNDFQNAYETGKLIRYQEQAARSDEIVRALNDGLFVLVAAMPSHCPFTDATNGTARFLISTHADRATANAAADQLYEDCPGDIDYYVLPKLPTMPSAGLIDDDMIPF